MRQPTVVRLAIAPIPTAPSTVPGKRAAREDGSEFSGDRREDSQTQSLRRSPLRGISSREGQDPVWRGGETTRLKSVKVEKPFGASGRDGEPETCAGETVCGNCPGDWLGRSPELTTSRAIERVVPPCYRRPSGFSSAIGGRRLSSRPLTRQNSRVRWERRLHERATAGVCPTALLPRVLSPHTHLGQFR